MTAYGERWPGRPCGSNGRVTVPKNSSASATKSVGSRCWRRRAQVSNAITTAAARTVRRIIAPLGTQCSVGGGNVSDEARWRLSEEERGRIQAAKTLGGTCAVCGRGLGAGETVWIRRFRLREEHGRATTWWVPAGVECVAPEFHRATRGTAPERCATCGRGVYFEPGARSGHRVFCSRACRRRDDYILRRERGAS